MLHVYSRVLKLCAGKKAVSFARHSAPVEGKWSQEISVEAYGYTIMVRNNILLYCVRLQSHLTWQFVEHTRTCTCKFNGKWNFESFLRPRGWLGFQSGLIGSSITTFVSTCT